jgi:hypothetical protein
MFKMFNDKWAVLKPGIMEFTQFIQQVFKEEFLRYIPELTSEYIDKIKNTKKD